MTRLAFTKMHGIGNDYVYVDCIDADLPGDPSLLAQRLSPRHTGIGSDGLILIKPSKVADARMEMYNADGSRGEMCGNGIRCVGKYLYERRQLNKTRLTIETDAGARSLELAVTDGSVEAVTVEMGAPIFDGPRIPMAIEGRAIDAPLEVETPAGTRSYRATCLSMGNPHCVIFVPDVETLDLEIVGPCVERHALFPRRVNAEFVHVAADGSLRMRVWERGSGETAACGTGACAVLVAAALTHRSPRKATVHLNGGDLRIEWRAGDDQVLMTGPAVEVFRGEIEI